MFELSQSGKIWEKISPVFLIVKASMVNGNQLKVELTFVVVAEFAVSVLSHINRNVEIRWCAVHSVASNKLEQN